jgi:hypothetical protein
MPSQQLNGLKGIDTCNDADCQLPTEPNHRRGDLLGDTDRLLLIDPGIGQLD